MMQVPACGFAEVKLFLRAMEVSHVLFGSSCWFVVARRVCTDAGSVWCTWPGLG